MEMPQGLIVAGPPEAVGVLQWPKTASSGLKLTRMTFGASYVFALSFVFGL